MAQCCPFILLICNFVVSLGSDRESNSDKFFRSYSGQTTKRYNMGNACLKELMVLIDHDVKGSIHILLERIYIFKQVATRRFFFVEQM